MISKPLKFKGCFNLSSKTVLAGSPASPEDEDSISLHVRPRTSSLWFFFPCSSNHSPLTRLGPPPPELLFLLSLPPQGAGSPQASLAMTSVLHLEFCVKSGCYTSETVEAEQEALGRGDGRRRVDSKVQTHQLRGAKPKVDNFLCEGEGMRRVCVYQVLGSLAVPSARRLVPAPAQSLFM